MYLSSEDKQEISGLAGIIYSLYNLGTKFCSHL